MKQKQVEKVLAGILAVILAASIWASVGLLAAWPFKWMWNGGVAPAIEGANDIQYWQAYYLCLFMWIFLKGLRGSEK